MPSPKNPRVVCFGEVLWDRFPSGESMGGAPLNVAFRLQSLGISTAMASAVGQDGSGDKLFREMGKWDVQTQLVQRCSHAESGWVQVSVDAEGVATYEIGEPVAWDFIQHTEDLEKAVRQCEAMVFGSLIGRSEISRQTLERLFAAARFRVFDVNLRPPFISMSTIVRWMREAHLVKCNEEEFAEIEAELGFSGGSWAERTARVHAYFGMPYLIVTRGSHGALVRFQESFIEHPGYPIDVVDTVGAGDAFTATFLEGVLMGRKPMESLNRACAMGALVAGSEGATSPVSAEEIDAFIAAHNR